MFVTISLVILPLVILAWFELDQYLAKKHAR